MNDRTTFLILNIVAIALLGLIGVGLLGAPRYNYGVIVSDQDALNVRCAAIERRLKALDLLAGENETQREATLAALDSVPALIVDLRERYEDLLAQLSESSWSPSSTPATMESDSALLAMNPETRDLANGFSPSGTAQEEFVDFLGSWRDREISGDPESLPRHVLDQVRLLFSLFKANVALVNQEEQLYIHDQVGLATAAGEFVELPPDTHSPPAESGSDEAVAVHVQVLESGLKRVFRLPFDEHPEFHRFAELRSIARDRLILGTLDLVQDAHE